MSGRPRQQPETLRCHLLISVRCRGRVATWPQASATVIAATPSLLLEPWAARSGTQHRTHLHFTGRHEEAATHGAAGENRSDEHTSELQSLMRLSYAVFCLQK